MRCQSGESAENDELANLGVSWSHSQLFFAVPDRYVKCEAWRMKIRREQNPEVVMMR